MDRTGDHRRLFERSGFTLLRSNNHQIWGCPCGHTQVVTSGSRHGGRGDRNAKAQIARALRACDPQPMKESA